MLEGAGKACMRTPLRMSLFDLTSPVISCPLSPIFYRTHPGNGLWIHNAGGLCTGRAGYKHEILGPVMLLASKAGGYMDNAVLAVDGGRNMVCPSSTMPPHKGDTTIRKLTNRSLGSMMEYPCRMGRTSCEQIQEYRLATHRYQPPRKKQERKNIA